MTTEINQTIINLLKQYGQEHLISGWDLLDEQEKNRFSEELLLIDFSQIHRLLKSKKNIDNSSNQLDLPDPEQAGPPANIVRLSDQDSNNADDSNALQLGQNALKAGKVGAVLVAGGQGTRLGFPHAKGMFEIGPLSRKSLFQIFIEQLLAASRDHQSIVPYFIMTSDDNHEETINFFKENNSFAYDPGKIFFFKQGVMPAVDADNGKLLLSAPGKLAMSPDGHGGLLNAIENAGLIKQMNDLGIEYLYYHQVDNPTAILCDPLLIGHHIQQQSELTTKVVAKRSPDEKMGVVCDCQGATRIIEYSDMPEEVARKIDESGEMIHWAGNMAIHVFNVELIEKLLNEQSGLPVHIAHKKVPYWDHANQEQVETDAPNAFKFEKFIFDALPFASKTLVVEADRSAEFNPVKNSTGDDSPEKVKVAISQLHKNWLNSVGIETAENVIIEISPLFAMSAEDLKGKIPAGTRIDKDTYYQ